MKLNLGRSIIAAVAAELVVGCTPARFAALGCILLARQFSQRSVVEPNKSLQPIAREDTRSGWTAALGGGTYGMKDVAGLLRRQLNGDLLLAMKAKDTVAISALRSVLSALDNASAIPASTVAAPVFGRNGDVPRRDLSDSDCQSIISTEVSARSAAAEEYTRLGRDDAAARLRAEQAVVERYVRTSEHAQQAVAADRREDAAPVEQ